MRKQINPVESIIIKEFSTTYDQAILSFLRKHHKTPVGEKVPTRISSILTSDHPLDNKQQLYEHVGKAIVQKKAKYFNDASFKPLIENSVFANKYGGLPGYFTALEQHSHIPKAEFIQLTEKYKHDLYSTQAVESFHTPIKQKMLQGIIAYLQSLPEEQQQEKVDAIVQKEKVYYEHLATLVPKFKDVLGFMYTQALTENLKQEEGTEDIPYRVIIPTKEKILATINSLEGKFNEYLTRTLDKMIESGIPTGNLKKLTDEYFSELKTKVTNQIELFKEKYALLAPGLTDLFLQKIAGNVDISEVFNPRTEIEQKLPESPLNITDYVNKPEDLRLASTGQVFDPYGKELTHQELKQLKKEGVDLNTIPTFEKNFSNKPLNLETVDLKNIDLNKQNIQVRDQNGVVQKLTPELLDEFKAKGIKLQLDPQLDQFSDFDKASTLNPEPNLENLINLEQEQNLFNKPLFNKPLETDFLNAVPKKKLNLSKPILNKPIKPI